MTEHNGTRRIGDLARETGTTVRTLQYYDRLGLLSPSSRTAGGHRCYTSDDVRRLHRIITLRSFGFSLGEIAETLGAEPDCDPAELVRRQLDVVNERISQIIDLRSRLLGVLNALDRTVEPSTTQFLRLIEEIMTVNQPLTPDKVAELIDARQKHMEELSDEEASELIRQRRETFSALGEQEQARLIQSRRQSSSLPRADTDE
jgi:MerR family transcriptional regulator, thiopeptide resistance regulator